MLQDEERSARVLAVLEAKDTEIASLQDAVRALEDTGTVHEEQTHLSDARAQRAVEQLDVLLIRSQQLEAELATECARSAEHLQVLAERDAQVTGLEALLQESAVELERERISLRESERTAATAVKRLEECQLSAAHLQAERETRGVALRDLEARELRLHSLLESTVAAEREADGVLRERDQRIEHLESCLMHRPVCTSLVRSMTEWRCLTHSIRPGRADAE